MTVSLLDLIRDWIPTAGWEILEVVPRLDTEFIGLIKRKDDTYSDAREYILIYNDRVTSSYIMSLHGKRLSNPQTTTDIIPSDPQFFDKLDILMKDTFFGKNAWYQSRGKPPRHQIWPK